MPQRPPPAAPSHNTATEAPSRSSDGGAGSVTDKPKNLAAATPRHGRKKAPFPAPERGQQRGEAPPPPSYSPASFASSELQRRRGRGRGRDGVNAGGRVSPRCRMCMGDWEGGRGGGLSLILLCLVILKFESNSIMSNSNCIMSCNFSAFTN